MTNRKDMIDDALLRPGRLEVQVEISLPDENGRLQILNIHTARMKSYDKLGSDVDLKVCKINHICLDLDLFLLLSDIYLFKN